MPIHVNPCENEKMYLDVKSLKSCQITGNEIRISYDIIKHRYRTELSDQYCVSPGNANVEWTSYYVKCQNYNVIG
jgi:hypothetical protein